MRVKVWDIQTRVCHWALVASFAAAWYTSRTEWLLDYHAWAGYAAGSLVVFRVLWGLGGGRHSRFSSFLRGWSSIRGFLAGLVRLKPDRYIGHNPAVGFMVMVMLATLSSIVISGVVTYGGEEGRGIAAGLVGFDAGEGAHAFHGYAAALLIWLVGIHVAAALVHDLIFAEGLVPAMVTGVKTLRPGESPPDGGRQEAPPWEGDGPGPVARPLALASAAVMAFAPLLYAATGDDAGFRPPDIMDDRGAAVVMDPAPLWKEECAGSCHGGFHPTLLPAASWRRVMSGLEDHFGEDASLDEDQVRDILDYLVSSSAERSSSEASRKTMRSIDRDAPAGRVTETPYWKRKHSGIPAGVFSRGSVVSASNCAACHPGSVVGSFEDRDIRIPG
ncbi:MAG: cytochrome b/b6 domain-containing protein [Thermodesulfobacteriota bacterium]